MKTFQEGLRGAEKAVRRATERSSPGAQER